MNGFFIFGLPLYYPAAMEEPDGTNLGIEQLSLRTLRRAAQFTNFLRSFAPKHLSDLYDWPLECQCGAVDTLKTRFMQTRSRDLSCHECGTLLLSSPAAGKAAAAYFQAETLSRSRNEKQSCLEPSVALLAGIEPHALSFFTSFSSGVSASLLKDLGLFRESERYASVLTAHHTHALRTKNPFRLSHFVRDDVAKRL